MALDEEDKKEIAKLIHDTTKALTSKSETKIAEGLSAKLDEIFAARDKAQQAKAEQEKAEAEKAKLPEIDKERLSLKERVLRMEADLKARDEENARLKLVAQQEKENTAFHGAWTTAKLVPKLGADHLKSLRADGRIIQGKDGAIRVRDPRKADFEEQPTLDEYVSTLAQSEEGAFYRPATNAHGGGASNGAKGGTGPGGKPARIENAVAMLLTGQKPD